MLAIVGERSGLIVIIAAGDGEDRNGEFGVLLGGRIVGVPVASRMGMGEPFLEDRRGIPEHDVEVFEGAGPTRTSGDTSISRTAVSPKIGCPARRGRW